jgi:hypothetical protein
MLRPLNFAATAVIALVAAGDPLAAQENAACEAAYNLMLNKIEREQSARSAESQFARHKLALRIYHACQTGHLADPNALFERLDKNKILAESAQG